MTTKIINLFFSLNENYHNYVNKSFREICVIVNVPSVHRALEVDVRLVGQPDV
jgi:hypothetical protein